jgi:glycine cleavage system H lipoate-binding protein
MTVLLVILMFAVFITIDYVLERRRARVEATAPAAATPAEPVMPPPLAAEPVWVAGYQLPEELYYHRGHTWARVVGPDTVLVGLDDFARKLIGSVEKLRLPPVGSWLRQGARAVRTLLGDRDADLVSPVDGEVVAVNRQLEERPELATDDPYGRGWLFKIRSSELARSLRNLLSGRLARRWLEDAREQLELELVALSGSVLRDGGAPVADFARHLPEEDWRRLVGEFLLTPDPEEREV